MQNHLLACLPAQEFARVAPLLKPVTLVRRTVIYNVGAPLSCVYFPCGGLVAQTATMADGQGLEILSIGREGAFGITALFGLSAASHEISVQMTGGAWRVDAEALKQALDDCPVLKDRLTRYFHSWFLKIAQVAACTGRHTVPQRCASKLLDASKRSGSMSLPLTHENLAYSLGVRRAGVTNALGELAQHGSIQCLRGSIEIRDVQKLRSMACECEAH